MKRFIFVCIVAVFAAGSLTGCDSLFGGKDKKKPAPPAPSKAASSPARAPAAPADYSEEELTPRDEFEKKARSSIDADNAEAELERLKREIESDGD